MKQILYIINIFAFFSCAKQGSEKLYHKQADLTINIENPSGKENEQEEYISNYIDTCFYVALETKDNEFIGEVSEIKIYNDTIFILDNQTKSFFIFDIKGKLIKRIQSVGKGPQGYVDIHDFTLNKEEKELILLDNIPLNCLVYSLDGNFKFKKKLKTHATKITWLEKESYALYNNFNGRLDNNKFNLFFTDLRGEIKEKAFPFPKEALVSGIAKWNYFFESNGTIFLSRYYDNTIYKISADTIIPHVYFNFGKHKLPENTYYKDYFSIDGKYVHTLTNYFETSRTKVIHYTVDHKRIMLLVDNKNTNHYVFTRGNDWKAEPYINQCYFPNTVLCVYNDYFCTEVGVQTIKNRFKTIESLLNPRNLEKFNKLEAVQNLKLKNSLDNPVLFFYKTKEF